MNTDVNKMVTAEHPQDALLAWFKNEQRTFAWRKTKDTYELAVAELLLQRTKAAQAEPVFLDVLQHYPTAAALAEADVDQVKGLIASLGLPVRARLLVEMAKGLETLPKNEPIDRRRLERIPGIGEYVADALEAFLWRREVCALDANVVRFLSRYYGRTFQPEARRAKEVRQLADAFVAGLDSAEINWAILDFCATICLPRKPKCTECPVQDSCASRQRQMSVE
jgi:A/G-specific adenine glycosylase